MKNYRNRDSARDSKLSGDSPYLDEKNRGQEYEKKRCSEGKIHKSLAFLLAVCHHGNRRRDFGHYNFALERLGYTDTDLRTFCRSTSASRAGRMAFSRRVPHDVQSHGRYGQVYGRPIPHESDVRYVDELHWRALFLPRASCRGKSGLSSHGAFYMCSGNLWAYIRRNFLLSEV